MKLDNLYIDSFKNLQNFKISFDEGHLVTAIVGWNGAGKSNLIEALVIIFRDLNLMEKAAFSYELNYLIRNEKVSVSAKQGEFPIVTVGSEMKKISRKNQNTYLPKQVFGYYSGPSDRLLSHFRKHQERFRDQILYPNRFGLREGELPQRPLFYAQNIHSLFVLLAFFFKEDDAIKNFLAEELRIESIESILFVIQEPYWSKGVKTQAGNPQFWNARGVVGDFLDRLYEIAIAPIRLTRSVEVAIKRNKTKEFVYLFIKSLEDIRRLANQFDTPGAFFKALESIHFSDLLGDLRIKVRIRNMDDSLTFKELSEGEQQLLMVLGLLRFTREEESLFLLDEPDTHLNPSWSVKYLDLLRRIVGADNEDSSHIILTSHDPILLGSLEPKQLQIMKRDDHGLVTAKTPEYGPRGLSYGGILTSPIFGLASELDSYTISLLYEKKMLETKENRTERDLARLRELDDEISHLGFQETFRDPDYMRFLKAWRKASKDFTRELVESEISQAEKEAKALELARRMLGIEL
jgi:predicted ATPase